MKEKNVKHFTDIAVKTIGILLLATFLGFALLCLVYMIPEKALSETRADMYSVMETETPGRTDTRFFSYAYGCKNNPEMFIYRLSGFAQGDPLFFKAVGENDEGDNRYWDGFMVIVMPLMALLSFGQIRFLFTFITFLLLWYIVTKSNERLPRYFSLSFVIGLVLINMIVNLFNVMLNMVFLVAFFFMAYMLKTYTVDTRPEKLYYLFLLNGILTTYLDRYTACLVALEMPLLLIVLINIYENAGDSLIRNRRNIIYSVIGWGIGFSFFWFNKWVISGLVLNRSILIATFRQILMRSATNANSSEVFIDGQKGNRIYTIAKNIASLIPTHGENMPVLIALVITIILGMAGYIIYRKGSLKDIKPYYPVVFLVMLPYVYYFVFSNLCQIHATFYMYRMQLVTVTGILYMYFEALGNGKEKKRHQE